MVARAKAIINRYGMERLESEGGYYSFLSGFGNNAGCILYLITSESFSSLHRLSNDEAWFFLEGDTALQYTFSEGKEAISTLSEDNRFSLVKEGQWQGTRLSEGGGYALFATVMSPRYSDEDFSLPDPEFIDSLKEGRYFYDGIHNSRFL